MSQAVDEEFQAIFRELQAAYLLKLLPKVNTITSDWRAYQQQANPLVWQRLVQNVHGLKGSGATFGFQTISDSAQAIYSLLELGEDKFTDQQKVGLEQAIMTLVTSAEDCLKQ